MTTDCEVCALDFSTRYLMFTPGLLADSDAHELLQSQVQQEVANRSRWHSILYEAGGLGAAVSEESMRRLKYCLQWLQVSFRAFIAVAF